METKKRKIEQTYYVAFDGKEFEDMESCEHYEETQRGNRKTCDNCNGRGKVTKDNDIGGDGGWGSSVGVQYWEEGCDKCNSKGYLELKKVWQ